jgi:hypothetical protein
MSDLRKYIDGYWQFQNARRVSVWKMRGRGMSELFLVGGGGPGCGYCGGGGGGYTKTVRTLPENTFIPLPAKTTIFVWEIRNANRGEPSVLGPYFSLGGHAPAGEKKGGHGGSGGGSYGAGGTDGGNGGATTGTGGVGGTGQGTTTREFGCAGAIPHGGGGGSHNGSYPTSGGACGGGNGGTNATNGFPASDGVSTTDCNGAGYGGGGGEGYTNGGPGCVFLRFRRVSHPPIPMAHVLMSETDVVQVQRRFRR